MGQGFPRQCRLLKPVDFKQVFGQTDCKSHDAFLTVLAHRNDKAVPRLGLAISKKQLKTAVQRNRVKRLIRESFRHHQDLLDGLDIVVMARKAIADIDNRQVLQQLERHWLRLSKKCGAS